MDFIYLVIEKQTNRVVRAFESAWSANNYLATLGSSKDYSLQIFKVHS